MNPKQFSEKLLAWYDLNGRKHLPWQKDINPYRVWVSEIMLQQTQVTTVIPYYNRFIEKFPTVAELANSHEDEVLHLWAGLGYYSRARNLHKTAKIILSDFGGIFPDNVNILMDFPGIGRSTASAILAISNNQRLAILDGNVKRVLTRFFAIEGWPGNSVVEKILWEKAESLVPQERLAEYTQAIMDLGAMVCVRGKAVCHECPLNDQCQAFLNQNVAAYPSPKPKKELPIKETILLVLYNDKKEILLEKRPPVGIWGGLWSFPECGVEEDITRWCERYLGYKVRNPKQGKVFSHIFSHFRLNITPVLAEFTNVGLVMETTNKVWYKVDPQTELTLGVAAPVKKLIKELEL